MKKIKTGKQFRSIKYVEEEKEKFPHYIIDAFLEWVLIILLFLDGFISFAANEFSKYFKLKTPCLYCTRIDHVLARKTQDYYNDNICHSHKKEVSCLAYCHVHKKLSDIRKMCEACLLSFATEKEADCDTYKSLVGILHKDVECFVEDDMQLSWPVKKDEGGGPGSSERNFYIKCSCCEVPMKVKSMHVKCKNPSQLVSQAPAPSPRASKNMEAQIRVTEPGGGENVDGIKFKDDGKAGIAPLATDSDNGNEDRTPIYGRGNKFFGIAFSDSASISPRFASRLGRKSPLESGEGADGESNIFNHLNRQGVRLDRRSLMALYMELDEERNASAVAANNAMAMITRLQAEKAAVQMEALQYQRMMEEQAEYDEEALQQANEILLKKDEEIRVLEAELEAYHRKHGDLEDFEDIDTQASHLQWKHGEEVPEKKNGEEPQEKKNGEETQGKPSEETEGENKSPEDSSEELEGQKQQQQGRLKKPDKKSIFEGLNHSSDENGSERKAMLTAQLIADVLNRLKSLEAKSELSKKSSEAVEGGGDVIKLLREISQDIEKLWLVVTIKSDNKDA